MASKSTIVVGIDFGTTHSGVSWAVDAGARHIRLIDNWPNPEGANVAKEKVPSEISYVDGRIDKWGFRVDPRQPAFKWVKVLLQQDHKYAQGVAPVAESRRLLQSMNKYPVQVIADYLGCLWQYTLEDIKNRQGEYFQNTFNIQVVLTVPAIWNEGAKNLTLKAARDAGIPGPIKAVTEPEAAALFTLKDKEESESLVEGDAFVVCDAGGGTVDLISYEVTGTNPLRIKEATMGDGDLCGSIFINEAFENNIKTLVGSQTYDNLKPAYKRRTMKDFELIKREFNGDLSQQYTCDLKGVPDSPENNIEDDQIMVKGQLLRTIFDQVCLRVESLVGKQIRQVKANNLTVKAILLVGGFGASNYLLERLKACHKSEGIPVLQTSRAMGAISCGATLWGLENLDSLSDVLNGKATPKTIVSRISRFSYGFPFAVPYNASVHDERDRVMDESTGRILAKDQMSWLLRKGEEIKEGRLLYTECTDSVHVGFRDTGERSFSQGLYFSNLDLPPRRLESRDVKLLCNVTWNIQCSTLWVNEKSVKNPYNKIKFRHPDFILFVYLGHGSLEYAVRYRNQFVGYVESNYADQRA